MGLRLRNKTALVTGGGSGIGQSVCLRLAQEGAHIIALDLTLESAQQTADKILANGDTVSTYACDVSNHAQVNEVLAEIQHTNIEQTSEADLDRLYNVNVKGVYNTTLACIKAMKERKNGVIINLASVASSVGIADRFAYSMSKGAVLTMTYSIAKDYVKDGIRCNCIAPGRVHTPFVDNFLDTNYPDNRAEMFEKLSKSQPMGRMGHADEIAALIAYLCSDEAAFITGSNFPIDGGFVTLNN
jgi:2-keto-3-deoxy-L-fuconate dehydrogenase